MRVFSPIKHQNFIKHVNQKGKLNYICLNVPKLCYLKKKVFFFQGKICKKKNMRFPIKLSKKLSFKFLP